MFLDYISCEVNPEEHLPTIGGAAALVQKLGGDGLRFKTDYETQVGANHFLLSGITRAGAAAVAKVANAYSLRVTRLDLSWEQGVGTAWDTAKMHLLGAKLETWFKQNRPRTQRTQDAHPFVTSLRYGSRSAATRLTYEINEQYPNSPSLDFLRVTWALRGEACQAVWSELAPDLNNPDALKSLWARLTNTILGPDWFGFGTNRESTISLRATEPEKQDFFLWLSNTVARRIAKEACKDKDNDPLTRISVAMKFLEFECIGHLPPGVV